MQGDLHASLLGYGAELAPSPVCRVVSPADAVAALQMDAEGMRDVSAFAAAATAGGEHNRRRRLVEEFNAWAARYPESVRPTLQWCSPMEVALFLNAWRKSHVGRWRPGEDCPVAPSTLRGVASRLAGICAGLGRHGPWSPERPGGDPTKHPHVQKMLDGYESVAFHEWGYSSSGAVPVVVDKFLALMAHLDARAEGADLYSRCLLLRDKVAFAYMWECGHRGKEVSRLTVQDLRYQDVACTGAWPDLSQGAPRAGATLLVEPGNGTKTRKTRHPGVVRLEVEVQPDGLGTFVATLPVYARAMAEFGTPLTSWLFRAGTQPEKGTFKSTACARSTLEERLKKHLRAMGVYMGETMHSFRRGGAQHEENEGVSREKICRKRHWRSEETAELYLHPLRHERRVARCMAAQSRSAAESS